MSVSSAPLSRRVVLGASAASAASATALAAAGPAAAVGKARRGRIEYPFTLGVASGDPEPTGVVLWTRLAPRPFDEGQGMRGNDRVQVRWQVATDERMRRVVARGNTATFDAWAHSVYVEARGLQPGREYWYRFESEGHLSPIGRTRTAPLRIHGWRSQE